MWYCIDMNILMMLSLSKGRGVTLLEALTSHHLDRAKRLNGRLVNHSLPEDRDTATKAAREALIEASTHPDDRPAKDQVKELLLDLIDGDDSGEKTEEMLAMLVGARSLREGLDDLEVTMGRALRIAGVPNHVLANATGMTERSASKRYKPRPGEGLSSRV